MRTNTTALQVLCGLSATVGLAVGAAMPGSAAEPDRVAVVELFTSQSCYSCPPAEAYLGELAARDGVIALEWHVDYWDDLVYGSHGRWQDRFSSAAHTARQSAYNAAIRGTNGVYTPQMVINGAVEAVGSRTDTVDAILNAALADGPVLPLTLSAEGIGAMALAPQALPARDTRLWLVTFIEAEVTDVRNGENHGKILENHHIVVDVRDLGAWDGATRMDIGEMALQPGEGCAVLAQAAGPGPIVAAGYCPDAGA